MNTTFTMLEWLEGTIVTFLFGYFLAHKSKRMKRKQRIQTQTDHREKNQQPPRAGRVKNGTHIQVEVKIENNTPNYNE